MILALLFAAAPAFAGEVVAPVPRPESWSESLPAPARDPLTDPGRLELGISAWAPHATDAPSRMGGTSAFEASGLPELRAAYVSPAMLDGNLGRVSIRGGLGLARLSRAGGGSTLPGSSLDSSQEFYLTSLRASAEWRPFHADRNRVWEPRISASLLPTLGIATRSALDDGGTHFGIPVELEATVAIGRGLPLLLGASFRAGKVDWVNLLGAGVNAGLSFGL